ncbi:MAG: LPXTG cell wall anchor domain-containing protein [Acidimicrobiia bacterium]|nr:LPXTG cell wall anchor domain-containing protein [Acidimicrobiia bacterium]
MERGDQPRARRQLDPRPRVRSVLRRHGRLGRAAERRLHGERVRRSRGRYDDLDRRRRPRRCARRRSSARDRRPERARHQPRPPDRHDGARGRARRRARDEPEDEPDRDLPETGSSMTGLLTAAGLLTGLGGLGCTALARRRR